MDFRRFFIRNFNNRRNLTLQITDMNQFLNDLKTLVKTHWKTIFIIVLVVYLFTSYTDIKAGIMDAWSGK
jgi:hypothetical protein